MADAKRVIVAGIVSGKRIHLAKGGQKIGFVSLEDLTGQIEAIFFNDQLEAAIGNPWQKGRRQFRPSDRPTARGECHTGWPNSGRPALRLCSAAATPSLELLQANTNTGSSISLSLANRFSLLRVRPTGLVLLPALGRHGGPTRGDLRVIGRHLEFQANLSAGKLTYQRPD